MKQITLLTALLFLNIGIRAQTFAWGVKGGLTVGQQKWDNSFERDLLLKYHGILFIETAEEDEKFSLFAQVGYHQKGSAIRYRYNTTTGGVLHYKREFIFQNASLTVGGKKRNEMSNGHFNYLFFGIRGDYQIKNNLNKIREQAGDCEQIYLPFDDKDVRTVKKITFGATLGAGLEFHFSELVGGLLELSINPDFSNQYNQGPINNLINTCSWSGSAGQTVSIPQRQIKNTTLELSLGLRFLRKVVYE